MAKVARVGKLEEVSFADEARTWAGVSVSEKLSRSGDFILAYRDPSGAPFNQECWSITRTKPLSRRATSTSSSVTPRSATSLSARRRSGRRASFDRLTRTPLGPEKTGSGYCERPANGYPVILKCSNLYSNECGPGLRFLERNAALAEEVRRTFADIDPIEKELGKAAKAIQSVSGLVAKYKRTVGEALRKSCAEQAITISNSFQQRPSIGGCVDFLGGLNGA